LLSSFSPAAMLNVGLYRTFMVIGGIGTILTAGYFLWMLQRVNQGDAPVKWREHHFKDILAVEWVSWVPLLALTLVLGLVPNIILNPTLHGAEAVSHLFTG
jgi:NADH-quinone oxidoreductase subunit M